MPPISLSNRHMSKLAVLAILILLIRNYSEHPETHNRKTTAEVVKESIVSATSSLSISDQYDSDSNISNNLVVINAVSREEVLSSVLHNTKEHFSKQYHDESNNIIYKWDCLLFLNVDETVVPNDNQYLQEIISNDYCSIQRFPGLRWSHYLSFLQPKLLSDKYDHIAILLDDIYLPSKNVDVLSLLQSIKTHNLASISPSIHEGHQPSIRPRAENNVISKCLADVELIEVFFQIFTMDAWECFHKSLHYSSGGGAPYDVCYAKKCQSHGVNAVDYRMKGYHLERSLDYLKEHNIDDIKFPKQNFAHTGGRGGCIGGITCPRSIENWVCGDIDVMEEINWHSPMVYPLECTDAPCNTQYTERVIHTYNSNNVDLDFWSDAWEDAGWKVKLLSERDARENYWSTKVLELFKSENIEDLYSNATLSLLTFLAMGNYGGYYADSTILPLRPFRDGETATLANHGRFTVSKTPDIDDLPLLSGTKDEWYRILLVLLNYRNTIPSNTLLKIYKEKPHAFHHNSNQDTDNTYSNAIVNINDYKNFTSDLNFCEKLRYKFGVYVPSNHVDMDVSKEQQQSFVQAWYHTYKEQCW